MTSPLAIYSEKPRFSWTLASPAAAPRGQRQGGYRVWIATTADKIRGAQGDIYDSGRINDDAMHHQPATALSLRSQTRYWWAVQVWNAQGIATDVSAPASFTTGLMHAADWQARWIAATPDTTPEALPPSAAGPHPMGNPEPLPIFRKEFALSGPLRQAIVSVCGLGHYELRANGQNVTATHLNPGWTNYRKTVLYDSYDITALLRPGANALAMMLGNGMYNCATFPGRYSKFTGSFGQPKLIVQMRLVYADGREESVVSDESWQWHRGPVRLSSAYDEDFDARDEPEGWDKPGFAATGWQKALTVAGPGGALRANPIPPVVEQKRFSPIAVSEPKPGVFVYDLGQNFSGWPQIVLSGPAGKTVRLIPGERRAADGTVRQLGHTDPAKIATIYGYTLTGRGREVWHPRFSYFGFRYVQVEGARPAQTAIGADGAQTPRIHGLEGIFLYADMEKTGDFTCSNDLFVRIHRLIQYALYSNSFSVLTDCPQREKLGWLEQTYLNADTVFCNEDALPVYEKMQRDMAESQTEDGMVPGIAPEYVAFVKQDGSSEIWRDSPEWGAACVFSPLAAYRYSGDDTILRNGFGTMQRYADYIEKKRGGGLVSFGMGDWYDIGQKAPGPAQLTSLALTGTATYYGILHDMARIGRIISRDSDAQKYDARAQEMARILNAQLFHAETQTYDLGSQTAHAMPLALGLVPVAQRAGVLANLIADIRKHDNHVTAGDIGFHYVVRVLMENDRADVLYDILSRTDRPSYGYQLAQGATALTEAWDANPGSSQNHFMLGHAESWFYRGLGGITIDMGAEQDRRIRIAPQTVAKMQGVSVRFRSIVGEISSSWQRKGGKLSFLIDIPAGMAAKIVLPATAIRESGRPLAKADGIRAATQSDGKTVLTVGSGRYRFAAKG